jgi:hypothetical protein
VVYIVANSVLIGPNPSTFPKSCETSQAFAMIAGSVTSSWKFGQILRPKLYQTWDWMWFAPFGNCLPKSRIMIAIPIQRFQDRDMFLIGSTFGLLKNTDSFLYPPKFPPLEQWGPIPGMKTRSCSIPKSNDSSQRGSSIWRQGLEGGKGAFLSGGIPPNCQIKMQFGWKLWA